MKFFGLLILAGLALFQIECGCCGARTGLTTPTPTPPALCCGDPNSQTARVAFSAIIASNSDEVPVELHGCGVNSDQITAIAINGSLAGCPSGVTFSRLVVTFTTASCFGAPTPSPPRVLAFNNVRYNGEMRTDLSPACLSRSSVEYEMVPGGDPGFTALFLNRSHEQTLLPILDRFVLRWAASSPQVVCPLGLTFAGIRGIASRCTS